MGYFSPNVASCYVFILAKKNLWATFWATFFTSTSGRRGRSPTLQKQRHYTLSVRPLLEKPHPSTRYDLFALATVKTRVARFFVQDTKTGKNIPNDHKIYQMAIKYFQWP
jgi:hypothetical protein